MSVDAGHAIVEDFIILDSRSGDRHGGLKIDRCLKQGFTIVRKARLLAFFEVRPHCRPNGNDDTR